MFTGYGHFTGFAEDPAQLSITAVPGEPMLSSDLFILIQMYMQAKH